MGGLGGMTRRPRACCASAVPCAVATPPRYRWRSLSLTSHRISWGRSQSTSRGQRSSQGARCPPPVSAGACSPSQRCCRRCHQPRIPHAAGRRPHPPLRCHAKRLEPQSTRGWRRRDTPCSLAWPLWHVSRGSFTNALALVLACTRSVSSHSGARCPRMCARPSSRASCSVGLTRLPRVLPLHQAHWPTVRRWR
jgi:hypothetical protein